MNTIEKLVRDLGALEDELATHSVERVDEEAAAIRQRLVALEEEARRGSILNGGAERALQAENEIVALKARLRRLEADRGGVERRRRELKSQIVAKKKGIARELAVLDRQRQVKVDVQVVKRIEESLAEYDSLDVQRAEEAAKYGVAPRRAESASYGALKEIWSGPLGQPVWQSPASRAAVKRAAERAEGDKKALQEKGLKAEEERIARLVRRGRLAKHKGEEILAKERERIST